MLERMRGWLANRLGRSETPALSAPHRDLPDHDFLYTVFWVKTTREWTREQRAVIAQAVQNVLDQPGFEATTTERRYSVPGLDGGYSGASLRALGRVLAEWAKREG